MVFRKNLRSLERRWEKISKFLGDLPSEQIFYRNIPLGAPEFCLDFDLESTEMIGDAESVILDEETSQDTGANNDPLEINYADYNMLPICVEQADEVAFTSNLSNKEKYQKWDFL